MARKLYIFGIGGTGSRVIKSLTMLLAAGVKLGNQFDTIVPIIIDPDIDNGDLNRTKDILRLYQEIRNQIKEPENFFKQELKTVNEMADAKNSDSGPEYFQFKLDDVDNQTFGQYIGFDSLSSNYKDSKDFKSFVKLLYSNSNLNSDLSVGFKGNPNMGSIVLNQFSNSQDFMRFGQTFGPGDAIFIINSIFGGTGAAGFPLLLKNLRGNQNLTNHAQIKDAPIGAITYLPYFTLDKRGEINSGSFEEKAKIALDYYNRTIINQKKINVLHFVGNLGNTNVEQYAIGGTNQKNKAHFLELAGALSIIEFCNQINNYTCNNGLTSDPTVIKEFGIERENAKISFDDLNLASKNQIYKPLTKFRLFTHYLENGLDKAIKFSRWTKSKFFAISQRKSLCNSEYFESSEYKNQIVAFNNHFTTWLNELANNKPAFAPFFDGNTEKLYKLLDINNCLYIDNYKDSSEINKNTNRPYEYHTILIRLFDKTTELLYGKVPVRDNSQIGKVKKVFRLHQGQVATGWFVSAQIDKNSLKSIKTEGKDVATSIPSPFARIDLVKSAFEWINYQFSSLVATLGEEKKNLPENKLKINNIFDGKTAQNKLISDALDVAQLFFKNQIYKEKLEIVAFDPTKRFDELMQARFTNLKNATFAEALKIYWDQDSIPEANRGAMPALYNFEHLNRMFFIINKKTKQVIGGTSPITLFFAAPDAKIAADGLNINFNGDTPFDDNFCPLHKREVAFIEFIYTIASQDNNFPTLFPEFFGYLENIKNYLLDDRIHSVVANLDSKSINKFKQCTLSSDERDNCEVLNFRLGVEKSLLEEKIIELPYSIDSTKYKTCGANKHLIPVTQSYIEKYGIEQIDENCKIEVLAGGGVKVVLTIPVQDENLEYQKVYHKSDIIKPDVHLAILPFLKPINSKIDYTIGILDDRPNKSESITISCFNKGEKLSQLGPSIVRNPGKNDVKSEYFKFSDTFDSIVLGVGSVKNLIVPIFKECNEIDNITFAIDFGTTNTHIEYSIKGNPPIKLENTVGLPMWQSLMNRNDSDIDTIISDRESTFDMEMIPYSISEPNSNNKFPIRTAIVYNNNYSFSSNNPYSLFQHVNNFLLYEKRKFPDHYLNFDTRLKWSNYEEANNDLKVSAYIEYLLTVVYFKTLLLGGKPINTKIIWFYPVSMEGAENTDGELGIFIKLWKSAFKKVFKTDNTNNLIQIPESIAPYLYYKRHQITGLSLSIDIGGGSSDIAVFDESSSTAKLISSFKFAGNAIFGDGYSSIGERGNSDSNGWVNAFIDDATNLEHSEYSQILKDILTRKDSEDFTSFLFSLKNDSAINFDYGRLIQRNGKLKLTILVFYSALAYYSANLLQKSGISIPKNILLSGTAAKTALLIDSSEGNLNNLASLFKFVFEKVYDNEAERDIVLKVSPEPKEITCKGALVSGVVESINENKIKFWLGGKDGGVWGTALDKSIDVSRTPKYKDINLETRESIYESIIRFYRILDEFISTIRFNEKFMIEPEAYDIFKKIRALDIDDFMTRSLKAFHKKEKRHIEETLFFYPLIGVLNKLAFELSKNTKHQ